MKKRGFLLRALFFLMPLLSVAQNDEASAPADTAAALVAEAADGQTAPDNEEVQAGSIIIGHVTDAHSWHLFDIKKKDGSEKAVAVPLPVILINDGKVDVFMSSKFHHGHADYKGYRLVGGGLEKEQIVCVDEAGAVIEGKSPIDLSITKTSAAIMIAVLLLIVILMVVRKQYLKRGDSAPHGLQNLVEMLVVHVRDDIAGPMLHDKTDKYLPYLLTLFFFIIFCNVLGLIPIFPAGANITGNIAVTAILALITFFITNIKGNKHYWKDIFNTPGVPAWLKIFPLMPLVEVVGVFTKPIVLMIRLFANMTAGHIVILGFVVIIFILSNLFGAAVGGAVSVVSVLFGVFISLLECLVAYIQAYVFTMLSALYIGMAIEEPEHVTE